MEWMEWVISWAILMGYQGRLFCMVMGWEGGGGMECILEFLIDKILKED